MAVPLSVKVALILLLVGLVIYLVGFSTSFWMKCQKPFTYKNEVEVIYQGIYSEHDGLWRRCFHMQWNEKDDYTRVKYTAGCFSMFSDEGRNVKTITGELRAVQFFETVALLLLIPTVLLLVLGTFVEACTNRKILPILSGVCAVVAGGSAIVGCIIYGTWDPVEDNLAWSFPLAIVGGVLFGVTGAIIIVGVLLGK